MIYISGCGIKPPKSDAEKVVRWWGARIVLAPLIEPSVVRQDYCGFNDKQYNQDAQNDFIGFLNGVFIRQVSGADLHCLGDTMSVADGKWISGRIYVGVARVVREKTDNNDPIRVIAGVWETSL